MRHLHLAIVGILGLALAGCLKEKKVPLQGERETVFLEEAELTPDVKGAANIRLSKAVVNKDWPMASGDSTHALPPLQLGKTLERVWSRNVGRGSDSDARLLNGPISAEGKVYTVDTQGMVRAIDLQNGQVVWEANSNPDQKSSQPFSGGLAYEDGYIFCATPAAEVIIFDAKDGKLINRIALTAPVRASPTVKNGLLYAVTINNQLEVINYNAGEPAWSHSGILETAGLLGGSSPAVSQDVVIVPYTSGEVYALRADNGMPLWSESLASFQRLDPVSSLFHIKARPIVKDQRVYLISHGGQMRALDLFSGQTLWMKEIGGIRTPAVSDDYLFMISANNDLVCFDSKTGQVLWVNPLPYDPEMKSPDHKILWAGPVLADDRLVVAGSHGVALVLSAKDGGILQSFSLPGKGLLSPIIVDQTLLFLTDNAELIAFR